MRECYATNNIIRAQTTNTKTQHSSSKSTQLSRLKFTGTAVSGTGYIFLDRTVTEIKNKHNATARALTSIMLKFAL